MTEMHDHNIAEDLKQISAVDQYLTFRVGNEDYGVPILNVQEIRGWESVARVPNTPEYVKGVLNLRGRSSCAMKWTARNASAASSSTRCRM